MPGAPIAAVPTGTGRFALFLADPGGGIYTTSGNAAQGWRPWTAVRELTTAPGAAISAVITAPSEVTLIVADVDGGVFARNNIRLE